MAEKLSARLSREQDICGPRHDFRNKEFFAWSQEVKVLEDRVKELEAEKEVSDERERR